MTAALSAALNGKPANGAGREVTTRERSIETADFLKANAAKIQAALPQHMRADRLLRIVLTEMQRVPLLAQCEKKSLFGAVVQAAQLGLEPGNGLGHAYLLPFRNNKKGIIECQLIIGYRGMIDLSRRSGQLISLTGEAVYKGDTFAYEFGLAPTLRHVPSEGERTELTHVYAIAHLVGGGIQFVVMPKREVDKIRARSRSKDSGPWVTDYEPMAIKTAIRRLFKYLPVSIEMQRAVVLDEAGDRGDQNNGALIEGADFSVAAEDDDPNAAGETVDTATGEVTATTAAGAAQSTPVEPGGDWEGKGSQKIAQALTDAKDSDRFNEALDLIRSAPPADQAALAEIARLKRARLGLTS